MEAFLRRYLPCMIRLWDYIWPPAAGGPPREVKIHTVSTPTPRAQEAGKVPAIDRSHKPLPLTPTVDSALPKPAVSLVYAALYDFEARCDEEMSVLQGERLVVLSEDGDFVKARKLSGPPSEGFVPTTYVTVLQDSLLNEPPGK